MLIFPERYRVGLFRNDLIVLDIKSDAFSVVSDAAANISFPTEYEELSEFLVENFLCYKLSALTPPDNVPETFLEMRWLRPSSEYPSGGVYNRFHSYRTIRKCKKLIDKGGYARIQDEVVRIRKRTSERKPESPPTDPEDIRIKKAIAFVNLSFNMFNFENPCLVYSSALACRLIADAVDARVIIGVRTAPFFSHAWVEVNDTVIGDDPALRSKLCVIMEI